MCGMFASITVSNEIDLPHFPEEIDRDDMSWQSKQGLDVYGGPYRITADGRLEQKKESYREKTDEEKAAEAAKWGYGSWDEYVQAYENMEDGNLHPDGIDYDADEDGYDETPPIAIPSDETLDEQWWADISHHGTFEFHQYIRRDPTSWEKQEKMTTGENDVEIPEEYALEVYLEYEARFDKGDLTDIVFIGIRGITPDADDDPIEHALEQIEEWREWKASNASRLDDKGDNK